MRKMKTYLEKEYCALEVAVGLARVRVLEEALEPSAP